MTTDTSQPSSGPKKRKSENGDKLQVSRKAHLTSGSAMEGIAKYFFFIMDEVSSDWRKLAFLLGFGRSERENINERNRDDKHRCMDLLEEWHNRKGREATIEVLMAALSEANLQRIVDGLKNKYPELQSSAPVLRVRAELGMVPQKSDQGSQEISEEITRRLWELHRELFIREVLMDDERRRQAEKVFLEQKAFLIEHMPGSVIFLLTFLRQTDVDRFYHNHFRVGEGTLSQQLSHILIPDELQGTIAGAQLIVRLHVKHKDYLRVIRDRIGQGLHRTTSLDNIPALPSHARRVDHSLRRGLDLAMVSESSQSSTEVTEDISTPAFTFREVQIALQTGRQKSQQQTECRLQAIQGELGTVREETKALGQGVTKLTQDEEAQKIITEIQQLQETNRNKEDKIKRMQHQIDASKQQTEATVHNLMTDVNRLKGSLEEAQKSLMKQRLEIQEQHETNKARERRIETMLREKEQSEAVVLSLKKEIVTLVEKDKKSQATLQKQKLEIQQLLETNKSSEIRIDELTAESTKLQTDVLKLSEEVQLLIEKDETSQQTLSEQKQEINQLQEVNKSSEVRIDELTAENTKLQTDILKLSEEVQELREKDETSQKVLSEQHLEINQLQEVNKSSESKIDELTADVTELQTDTRKRSDEIRELRENDVTSQTILLEQRLEIQQLEETIKNKEERIKILHTARQEADATVHSLSKEITSLKEEMEEILRKQKPKIEQLQEADKSMAAPIEQLQSDKQPGDDRSQVEGHEMDKDPGKEETKIGPEGRAIDKDSEHDQTPFEEMDQDTFYRAVEEGDVPTVQRGLKAGVDVRVKRDWGEKDGQTSLHVASRYGRIEVVELLIHHGSDMEARDGVKCTPLHLAASTGHTGTCELLIRNGADVMARNEDGQTSLHVSSMYGHTGVAQLLIRHGSGVEARDRVNYTPLHLAASSGHTGTCELLIRNGADVMARNENESTPLHQAAAGDYVVTCELLIRFGAEVNAINLSGRTPLDIARDRETRGFMKNLGKQVKKEKSYHELMQKSGGVKVNRFKVFLGGNETTGKSTLKRSLTKGLLSALIQRLSRRPVSQPHDPTPGVDIGTFHVPGVGEVSVWDFAGQAEYAVTHSMFMDAENTVFIVLYNITDDSETQEQEVHWWLCFIKSCNPNRQPDVILVASHADQVALATERRRADLVVQTMKAEFKDHLRIADEVILMDCRQTRTPEMDQLKALLVRMKDVLLQSQRDMPRLCAEIIKRLPEWCKKISPKFPVMTWHQYVEEVRKLDKLVTEDFLLTSTRFLHHSGEVIFITPATSNPILVLKPNWLGTDVFGPIMAPDYFDIHLKRTSEDYVTKAEIRRVFQDVADVDLVIDLLQEFQLCHTYNGREFILPGLLTQTMPYEIWKPIAEPKVVYFGKQVQCADSTDMFSSRFFPRVQTRLMTELENRPQLWRDGAKCADRNVEGLIKLSLDSRAVNICVRSAQGDKVQCGKMLQQLENITADVLYECSPGTGTVERVLSARALKERREEFYSYSKEEITKAAAEGGTIHHPTLRFTERVSDLLCGEAEDPWLKFKGAAAPPLTS